VSDAENRFVIKEKARNIANVVEDIVIGKIMINCTGDEGIYIQLGNYSFEKNSTATLYGLFVSQVR
jgi:hypothetical protein